MGSCQKPISLLFYFVNILVARALLFGLCVFRPSHGGVCHSELFRFFLNRPQYLYNFAKCIYIYQEVLQFLFNPSLDLIRK